MTSAPRSIVVVDDSARDIELFAAACEVAELDVRIASFTEGAAAIDAFTGLAATVAAGAAGSAPAVPAALPEAIVLDLNMPGTNGFQVLEFLKSHPVMRAVPVYILTTSNSPRDRERCRQLGADRYLVKPPSFTSLVELLKDVLYGVAR